MGIRLAGGRAYYIQAVGAQSGGRDCLSVGVQLPTGVVIRPITRHFLTRAPIGKLILHLPLCPSPDYLIAWLSLRQRGSRFLPIMCFMLCVPLVW